MMVINISVDDYQMENLFPFAIRTKLDYILILLNFLNLIESYPYTLNSNCDRNNFLLIFNSTMNRFFIVKEMQITSGYIPLSMQLINQKIYIKLREINVDFSILRIIQMIVSELRYQEDMYGQLTLADIVGITDSFLDENFAEDDLNDEIGVKVHAIISHLLYCEDSYFRYDIDEVNENGSIHPLHHFDIFYSNLSTFKLGLNSHQDVNNIINILDKNSDCLYLI